jgi:DNA-binding HxlR family transcriptional regulator
MVRNFPETDVFIKDCPTQQVLEVIADKWSVIVIYTLYGNREPYNQLQRQIGGISQKMLTQTLRKLERNGLVERRFILWFHPR